MRWRAGACRLTGRSGTRDISISISLVGERQKADHFAIPLSILRDRKDYEGEDMVEAFFTGFDFTFLASPSQICFSHTFVSARPLLCFAHLRMRVLCTKCIEGRAHTYGESKGVCVWICVKECITV